MELELKKIFSVKFFHFIGKPNIPDQPIDRTNLNIDPQIWFANLDDISDDVSYRQVVQFYEYLKILHCFSAKQLMWIIKQMRHSWNGEFFKNFLPVEYFFSTKILKMCYLVKKKRFFFTIQHTFSKLSRRRNCFEALLISSRQVSTTCEETSSWKCSFILSFFLSFLKSYSQRMQVPQDHRKY